MTMQIALECEWHDAELGDSQLCLSEDLIFYCSYS